MDDCQFFAFHGWGFDKKFWQTWSDELSKFGSFQAVDRGYFGNPRDMEMKDGDGPVVVIAHSFGLHWLEKSLLEQTDILIIAGGFLYFHPYAAQYKRRSRLVLQEMINELEVNPEKVLTDFYESCFAPEPLPEIDFNVIDHQLLLDDLKKLHDVEIDVELLKKATKVCILHGSKDRIVSNKKGRQIYNQLQEQSQYFEIKNAGHALPLTHNRQCLEFILPEIKQMRQPKV